MPEDAARIEQATGLMMDFARRTGLTTDEPPERYLWTDAFGVCNFLGLARATGDETYRKLARDLIDQAHRTLGRHRADDPRTGQLSGLCGEAARRHPTRGGLRIGKPLPERGPGEPIDERLEWDRDGQYFHYLTKWMHALDVMARASGEAHYARWARELAEAAGQAFVYRGPSGQPLMYWKMSIDLSRPLVPSMGHHDPLEGVIILQQLRATAEQFGKGGSVLTDELRTFERMAQGRKWRTTDPLGLGGLLIDATRLAQLIQRGDATDRALLEGLLRSAEAGIERWAGATSLGRPANRRLAFRELGLVIGLEGVRWIGQTVHAGALSEHLSLGERILAFWLRPANRRGQTWLDHQEINAVMLATALAPEGFLALPQLERPGHSDA